jgi:hypothetical protein
MPEVNAPSPSELVATAIAEKLSAKNLIPPEKATSLKSNILAGKMSAQEWKLLLEMALPKEGGDEHASKA